MQGEYVSAGFDVKADRKGVVVGRVQLVGQYCVILSVESYPFY